MRRCAAWDVVEQPHDRRHVGVADRQVHAAIVPAHRACDK
jgi:hypothetical protein